MSEKQPPAIEVLQDEIRKLGNEMEQVRLEINEHQKTIEKHRKRLTEIDTRIRAIKMGINILENPEARAAASRSSPKDALEDWNRPEEDEAWKNL